VGRRKPKVFVYCAVHGPEKKMLRSQAHSHHIIMRARGGTDRTQVFLCPDCHTTIHRLIEAEEAGNTGDVVGLLEMYTDEQAKILVDIARKGHESLDSPESAERVLAVRLPAKAVEELRRLCLGKRIKGRQIGVSRFARMILLSHLARHGFDFSNNP